MERVNLIHHIDGLRILDEDRAYLFSTSLLGNISAGIEHGDWSEESEPELFEKLRERLKTDKNWYLKNERFVTSLRCLREEYPRSHWWLWIEEW